MCIMSRFRSQQSSEQIYELEETREEMRRPKADPVWELREEYLERVRQAELEDMRKQEANREKDTEGNVKWWL